MASSLRTQQRTKTRKGYGYLELTAWMHSQAGKHVQQKHGTELCGTIRGPSHSSCLGCCRPGHIRWAGTWACDKGTGCFQCKVMWRRKGAAMCTSKASSKTWATHLSANRNTVARLSLSLVTSQACINTVWRALPRSRQSQKSPGLVSLCTL